jgi:hypothetical protein
MLIFAFVIRGLKEFGEPTRKGLIVKLANEGSKATHLRYLLFICYETLLYRLLRCLAHPCG